MKEAGGSLPTEIIFHQAKVALTPFISGIRLKYGARLGLLRGSAGETSVNCTMPNGVFVQNARGMSTPNGVEAIATTTSYLYGLTISPTQGGSGPCSLNMPTQTGQFWTINADTNQTLRYISGLEGQYLGSLFFHFGITTPGKQLFTGA